MSKLIIQIVILSGQLLSRAFIKAVRQEIHAAQEARRIGQNATRKSTQETPPIYGRITADESKKILDFNHSDIKFEELEKRFKFLYDINSNQKANSPYLQSKILQAKECLEKELKKS